MDSGRKRRGPKGKLAMPFYRPSKASPVQYSKVIKPVPPPSAASFGIILVEDEFVMAPSKLKAAAAAAANSFVKKEGAGGGHDHFGGYVDGHGDHEAVVSEVDRRAANYISYVQERFRMEHLDDDRRKYY